MPLDPKVDPAVDPKDSAIAAQQTQIAELQARIATLEQAASATAVNHLAELAGISATADKAARDLSESAARIGSCRRVLTEALAGLQEPADARRAALLAQKAAIEAELA